MGDPKKQPAVTPIDLDLSSEIFEMVKEKIELPEHVTELTLYFGIREPLVATVTFYPVRKKDEC